jgi:hypothetical protein
MEEKKARQTTMEEQMLKAMSMSLYGRQVQSRCRILSPAQKAELDEAAIAGFMKDYNIDREKAEAMLRRQNG